MIFASFVFLAISHKCRAFSYDDIESIDDIYRYYYGGQIDRVQFEYLLEMFDFGRITYEDLLSIGIGEPVELNNKHDSLFQSGIFRLTGQTRIHKVGLREYFEPDGVTSGNYYCNLNIAGADYRFKVRSKGSTYYCDNRSIQFSSDSVRAELGNFLVLEGYGLTIGRFDYQPSAGFDRDYDFDIWCPINSHYNGVKTEFGTRAYSGRFYSSIKYYDNIKKRFVGGGGSFARANFTLGLSCGHNSVEIDKSEDARMSEGVFFTIANPDYRIGGEIAQVKRNIGYYFNWVRFGDFGTFATDFWHYARHFENYNCSGKAASDYHSFYPTDKSVGFRTAQAGETGITARFANGHYAFGWQAWKQADNPELSMMVSARHKMKLADLAALSNQVNYMVKNDKGAFWWKGIVSDLPLLYLERLGFKVESGNPKIDNSDSYCFFTIGGRFTDVLNIQADIRGYFDEVWRTIISEKALLTGGFYLDIELIYGDNWRASAIFEKAL